MEMVRNAVLAATLVAGLLGTGAYAQSTAEYPNKVIKIVAPFAAGGVTDIGARYYASLLEKRLGASVIVENRPGAGGTIGAGVVARSAPDGYTILFSSGSSLTSIFNKDGAVDPLKELTAISAIHRGSWYLFASSKLPVTNLNDLIAYSKNNPGKLNVATQSTPVLLAMAWLKGRAGFDYVAVPYKSGGLVATAIRAGEVHVAFDALAAYLPLLADGTARAILVASDSRAAVTPNVPSSIEAGIPAFNADYTQGFWGAAGTPQAVVAKLAAASQAMLSNAEVKAQVQKLLGTTALGTGPDALRRAVEAEIRFWSEAARTANYKPE